MLEWLAPTAILGTLGVISVFIGRLFTRRNDKDTLLLASRDSFIDDLRERLEAVESKVEKQEEKIRDLQNREWGLRRYVQRLIDFIRANDLHPPDPPTDINL